MKTYTIVLLLCFLFAQSIVAQNLVFHLNFNNNTTDQTGNNVGAVSGNPVFVNGQNGAANSALRFDGIDDYLVFPPDSSLNFANGFTIFTTLKPNGYYQGNCHGNVIICKGSVRTAGCYGLQFTDDLYNQFQNTNSCATNIVETNKETFCGIRNTSGTSYANVNENTPANFGNLSQNITAYNTYTNAASFASTTDWHCVKYTYNKQTGISKIFVNNNLVGTNNNFPSFISNNLDNLTIGRMIDALYPNHTYQINADLDDIKIFDGPIESNITGGDNNVVFCGLANTVKSVTHINNQILINPIYENGIVTNIQYKITNSFKNAHVIITNLEGKIITNYLLDKKEGMQTINNQWFANGIYVAKLIVDNQIAQVVKLSIQNR